MTNYRRTYIPGATWFFTVNLAERRSQLLVDRIDTLRQALSYVQKRHPFRIDAMVVLPDHLYAVWTLPPGDSDYPLRWRLLKTWFSRQIPPGERRRASRVAKGERGIWQRRYWERLIRDEADLRSHIDYIHFNPVKHGYVSKAVDWPYSTFHRYVKDGILPSNWGVAAGRDADFEERL
jgi:putative transposase